MSRSNRTPRTRTRVHKDKRREELDRMARDGWPGSSGWFREKMRDPELREVYEREWLALAAEEDRYGPITPACTDPHEIAEMAEEHRKTTDYEEDG